MTQKQKKSRLTRIRPSNFLINHFERIKKLENGNYNHIKREFLHIFENGKLFEYPDSYESGEIRSVMKYYNTLISKTLFDIPDQEKEYLVRGDNRKKLVISRFPTTNYSYERSLPNQTLINGCW